MLDQLMAFGSAYAADAAMSICIFIVFFILIGILFARAQTLPLLKGLLFSIGWIFSSPFVYVKKTIGEIAGIHKSNAHRDTANDQYLISRFLLILRAFVVVFSIGILATSVVKGWEDFLPAKYLRAAEASTETTQDTVQKQMDTLQATVTAQDNAWNTQKAQIMQQHQANRAKKASDAITANRALETTLAGDQSLANLKAYLQNQPHDTASEVYSATRNAKYLIEQLNSAHVAELRQYADNWAASEVNTQTEDSPEDAARMDVQSDYIQNKSRLADATAQQAEITQELSQIRQQEKYSPDQFLLDLIEGVFSFMFFVWALGLALEALLIAIFIAHDVRAIRIAKEPTRSVETAT